MANGAEGTLSGRFAQSMTSPTDPTVVNVAGEAPQLEAEQSRGSLVAPGPAQAAPTVAQQGGLPPLLPGRGLLANILAGALLGAASGVATRQRGAGAVLSGLGGGFATNFGARQQIQQRQQQQVNVEADREIRQGQLTVQQKELQLKVQEVNRFLSQAGQRAAQKLFETMGNKWRPLTKEEQEERSLLGKTPFDRLLPVGELNAQGQPTMVAFAFDTAKAPATKALKTKVGKDLIVTKPIGTEENTFDVHKIKVTKAEERLGERTKPNKSEVINVLGRQFLADIKAAQGGTPLSVSAIAAALQEELSDPSSKFLPLMAAGGITDKELIANTLEIAKQIEATRREGQMTGKFKIPAAAQTAPEGGGPRRPINVGDAPTIVLRNQQEAAVPLDIGDSMVKRVRGAKTPTGKLLFQFDPAQKEWIVNREAWAEFTPEQQTILIEDLGENFGLGLLNPSSAQ